MGFVDITFKNIIKSSLKDPYGDGTYPNARGGNIIALCEGWANFIQNKIIHDIYQNSEKIPSYLCNLEKFIMHTVPSRINKDPNTFMSGRQWFLHGLMYDLVDSDKDAVILKNGQNNGVIPKKNNLDKVY